MSKLVWRDRFVGEAWAMDSRLISCFLQKQVNREAGQRLPDAIGKRNHRIELGQRRKPALQDLSRSWPERYKSFFPPFGGHDQLQLMPPGRVKPSGLRIHTTRCPDGSTSSSRTATAGEAIASISTTTQADCGRSLPVGPTLWRTIRLWLWLRGDPRSAWPICSRSPI